MSDIPQERSARTRQANQQLTVPFDGGARPEEIRHARTKRRNIHVAKLHEIVRAIEHDQAKVDELYPIAEFGARNGAAVARRTMRKFRTDWPALREPFRFTLKTQIREDGTSRLWAGVLSDVDQQPDSWPFKPDPPDYNAPADLPPPATGAQP